MTPLLVRSIGLFAATLLSACSADAPWTNSAQAQSSGVQTTGTATSAPRLSGSLASTGFGRTVAQAVQSQPDIAITVADINAARADIRAAEGGFRPAFSIGANARTNVSNRATSIDEQSSPYLRVRQLIYDGGVVRNTKAEAAAALARARDEQLVTASALTLTAVETYLDVRSARARLALLQRNLETHREILSQIEARRLAGAGGESDLLTIRSRFADADTLVIDAEARLAQAIARYRQIYTVTPGTLGTVPGAPSLSGNNQKAVARSPRLRGIDNEILAAQARVEQAKSARLPRVELVGSARRNSDGDPDALLDLSIDYQFDSQNEAAANIDRANADLHGVKSEKARLVRDITRALEFLRADRIAADKRLDAARVAADVNRANVGAAEEEFSIGRKTLIEVLDAQRDLVRSEETLVASERQQILVGYEALALTGDIISAFGIILPETAAAQ